MARIWGKKKHVVVVNGRKHTVTTFRRSDEGGEDYGSETNGVAWGVGKKSRKQALQDAIEDLKK